MGVEPRRLLLKHILTSPIPKQSSPISSNPEWRLDWGCLYNPTGHHHPGGVEVGGGGGWPSELYVCSINPSPIPTFDLGIKPRDSHDLESLGLLIILSMIFYFDSLIGDWLFCPCSGQLQPGPSGGGAEREGGVAEHPGEGDGPAEQPPVRQVHDGVCQACLIMIIVCCQIGTVPPVRHWTRPTDPGDNAAQDILITHLQQWSGYIDNETPAHA